MSMAGKRYYGADVPRSTGPHPDPMADEPVWVEDRCPHCNRSWELFPPARVDEAIYVNGTIDHFAPGPMVRCVDCKSTFNRPLG